MNVGKQQQGGSAQIFFHEMSTVEQYTLLTPTFFGKITTEMPLFEHKTGGSGEKSVWDERNIFEGEENLLTMPGKEKKPPSGVATNKYFPHGKKNSRSKSFWGSTTRGFGEVARRISPKRRGYVRDTNGGTVM